MTSKHPQRCETCHHYESGGQWCIPVKTRLSQLEIELIALVGCASHSSASEPVPEQNPCEESGCTDIENCDEICYSPAYVRESRQKARAEVLDAFTGFIDAYSRCDEHGQDYVSVIALQNHIESLRQQGEP